MRKSRCVIVSTNNQSLIDYWLKLFKRWEGKVDKVYVGDSTQGGIKLDHPKVAVYCCGLYPENIERLIRESTEDILLIMHDDVFVYDSDLVDNYFTLAEEKVVTPIQGNYSNIGVVNEAMDAKFGVHYSFYPYFLFVSRENILKTSINLKEYDSEKCPILGVKVGGDQGFLLGLELLNAGVEFHPLENIVTAGIPHAVQVPDNPPWVHAQGLTYGFLESINLIKSEDGRVQMGNEIRLAWLAEFLGLDTKRVNKFQRMFQSWGRNQV